MLLSRVDQSKGNDMLKKREQTALHRFKEMLVKQFGSEIKGIRLFGSKARGDATSESDIDVLVITQHDDWHLKEKIGKLATAILLEEDVYLSVKVLGEPSYRRLRKYHSPFLINVEREGITL
jgi:predicted nucleotidyltransferase